MRDVGGTEADSLHPGGAKMAIPLHLGRYLVTIGSQTQSRVARIEAKEILSRSQELTNTTSWQRGAGSMAKVDVSKEAAWLLLVLFCAELMARMVKHWRPTLGARSAIRLGRTSPQANGS